VVSKMIGIVKIPSELELVKDTKINMLQFFMSRENETHNRPN